MEKHEELKNKGDPAGERGVGRTQWTGAGWFRDGYQEEEKPLRNFNARKSDENHKSIHQTFEAEKSILGGGTILIISETKHALAADKESSKEMRTRPLNHLAEGKIRLFVEI